jgi:hypothetical protein
MKLLFLILFAISIGSAMGSEIQCANEEARRITVEKLNRLRAQNRLRPTTEKEVFGKEVFVDCEVRIAFPVFRSMKELSDAITNSEIVQKSGRGVPLEVAYEMLTEFRQNEKLGGERSLTQDFCK